MVLIKPPARSRSGTSGQRGTRTAISRADVIRRSSVVRCLLFAHILRKCPRGLSGELKESMEQKGPESLLSGRRERAETLSHHLSCLQLASIHSSSSLFQNTHSGPFVLPPETIPPLPPGCSPLGDAGGSVSLHCPLVVWQGHPGTSLTVVSPASEGW